MQLSPYARHLRGEGPLRTAGPHGLAEQLQGLPDRSAYARGGFFERPAGLRGVHREGDEASCGRLAPGGVSRRQGEVGADGPAALSESFPLPHLY